MRPLKEPEIRDINIEIQERLAGLRSFEEFVEVRSFKGQKIYGVGHSLPHKDLILRNLVRLMGGIMRPRPDADLDTEVQLTDTTNTSRPLTVSRVNTPRDFNQGNAAPWARLGSILGFGNPASAPTPTRNDYELASLVSIITPSSTATDETNWRVVVTGSYVWVAGGTVREAGHYLNMCQRDNNIWNLYLVAHDAVSDVVVPAGGTVSVTYTWQF